MKSNTFKGATKKISVAKLEKENDRPKRTKGSRIEKKLERKGLKKFIIDGTPVWAINLANAKRKVKNKGLKN